MEGFMNTQYLLAIGGAVVLLAIFYYFTRNKSSVRSETPAAADLGIMVFSHVQDDIQGKVYCTDVPLSKITELPNFKRDFEGKKVFDLVRKERLDTESGEVSDYYEPIPGPSHYGTSISLFYDMQHPEIKIAGKEMLTDDKTFMEKYGQILWWGAVMAFIGLMYMQG